MWTRLKDLLRRDYVRRAEETSRSTASSQSTKSTFVTGAVSDSSGLSVRLEFKSKRDFEEFSLADERIQAIALWTAWIMRRFWSYQAVVTSVMRTSAEQTALYKKGLTKLKISPHMVGRAIDIRLKDMPEKERHVPILLEKINSKWPRSDGHRTAMAHGEGANRHLHIQVPAQPREA